MSTRMISDFLYRIAREREADARGSRRRRPVAALLRYAVLGAVALSILPASAAASLPTHAQDKSGTRADSEPRFVPERPAQTNAAADGVRRPPRVDTRPFKELLLKGKGLYDSGRLDLSRTIDLALVADREDDGSLVSIASAGAPLNDPLVFQFVKETVDTISQSRLLGFLDGTRRIRLDLSLDEQKLTITARTEVASEEYARKMASGYGALLAYARLMERERPSGVVWNHTGLMADGKQFAVTLEMSREQAGQLLLQLITPN
ncbi:MAG TPA: hypothetical protein VF240_10325 [Pyrinomonadaceae bacterium]